MTHSPLATARRPIGALAAAALTAGALVAVAVPAAAVLGTARAGVTPSIVVAPAAGQGQVTADCVDTCELYAAATTASLRSSASTVINPDVWVFSTTPTPTQARSAIIRGTVGSPISIKVHNSLPTLPAQIAPLTSSLTLTIPQAGTGEVSDHQSISNGLDHTYTFTPTRPGTYVYEAGIPSDLSGSDGTRQVAMGLVGAIIVAPAANDYCTAHQSYCDAETVTTGFEDEAVLVYTDIDAAFAADPAGFNMRDYKPQYHLINGAAEKDIVGIQTDYTHRVLLRLVNGSILEKSPTLLGLTMRQFGRGTRPASPILDSPGQIVNTGEAIDATVTMPAAPGTGAPATDPTRFALFDSPIHLNNASWTTAGSKNSATLAGAIAYLVVGAAGTTLVGPDTRLNAPIGSPGSQAGRSITVTGTVTGSSNITNAEYFIDSVGVSGHGTQLPTDTGYTYNTAPSVNVRLVLNPADAALLTDGSHTLFAHGTDLSGVWGPVRSVAFKIDNHGPIISAVSPATAYVNGTKALAFSGTVSDATTGGSNVRTTLGVTASFDGGTAAGVTTNSTVAAPRVTGAFSGSLPAATFVAPFPEGSHTLTLTGYDQYGQASQLPYVLPVVVDRTAPVTKRIILRPPATNGTSSNPAKPGTIGITADILDPSPITVVEAYLKKVDPTGSISGIQLTLVGPSPVGDGSMRYTADMPLSWVGSYLTGASTSVTLYVVGMDAAGNRDNAGLAANSTPFLIDKEAPTTVPTVTAVQQTGVPGDQLVTVTATGADRSGAGLVPSGISGGEWWVGTDPGVGLANPMTQVTPGATLASTYTVTGTMDLNTLGLASLSTNQSITVRVRLKDGASNWGPVGTRAFTIVPVKTIFFDGFESTAAPLPWTSQTTTNSGTAAFSAAAPLAGSQSLLVTAPTGTSTAYVTKDLVPYPSHTLVVAKVTVAPDAVNTGTSSSSYVTLLRGTQTATGTSTAYVEVRYQRIGGTARFALCTRTGGGGGTLTCTPFATVAGSSPYALVLTYATNTGTQLTVNGTTFSRSSSVGGRTLGAIRIGVVAQSSSTGVTARFDSFGSARGNF